jgi:hypothetical protein
MFRGVVSGASNYRTKGDKLWRAFSALISRFTLTNEMEKLEPKFKLAHCQHRPAEETVSKSKPTDRCWLACSASAGSGPKAN